jgi:hypothetical protein
MIGEIEKTFLRYFPMGAHLRGLLSRIRWPHEPEYTNMEKKFETTFDTHSRGTLVNDILSWASSVEASANKFTPVTNLNATEYDAFMRRVNSTASTTYVPWDAAIGSSPSLSDRVQEIRSVKISGTTFSNSLTSKNKGDGYVLFRSPGAISGPSNPVPVLAGRIEKIFLHSHTKPGTDNVIKEPYLVVREYQSLSKHHAQLDPFARIPHLETKLCYNSFNDQPHVIMASDLISHFASFVYKPDDIDRDCIVVLSLDRVRPLPDHNSTTSLTPYSSRNLYVQVQERPESEERKGVRIAQRDPRKVTESHIR